ncbi:MAG: hypothetical protein GY940_11315, partial [bacterium]|nr:hypothetical protein [bacterium]
KASYRFTPDISLAATGRYVGAMESLWDVTLNNPGGEIGGGGRIAQSVDGYFLMDANLRFKNLFGKGYYLNLRCTNVFGKDFLYPLFTNNSGWADKGMFGNARKFMVTIGKTF